MGRTAGVHNATFAPDARENVTALTDDGSITELPDEYGPHDAFRVDGEMRKEYGIGDHEEPFWARDPQYWAAKGETIDRVRELCGAAGRGGGKGARLVTTPEMDRIHIGGGTQGDLVLVAIPKAVKERDQAVIDRAAADYQKGMQRTDEGYVKSEDLFDRDDLKDRMHAEHEYHNRIGMVGGSSPTKGMSYTQAINAMRGKEAEVAAKQEMLRNGSMHSTVSKQDFDRLMSGQRRLHGMGNSGLGKSTQQKVAEKSRTGRA